MASVNKCIDYYDETLQIGDYVIPISGTALKLGFEGYISDIVYSKKYDDNYITIIDNNGNILVDDINSRLYSTLERKDIRENKKYVYSLTCYNSEFQRISVLPLTNTTDINYEIPKQTCYMSIDAFYLEEKGRELKRERILTCYSLNPLYYFLIGNKLDVSLSEEHDKVVFFTEDIFFPQIIKDDFKIFSCQEELADYIRRIIDAFKKANLNGINNEKEYRKNKPVKKFEEQLILELKKPC